MAVARCSVGVQLNTQCYLTRYVKQDDSVVSIDSIDDFDAQIVKWRVNMDNIPTICLHHISAYTTHFDRHVQGKKCANLLSVHDSNSKIPKGVKIVSMDMCKLLKTKMPQVHVYPGQRLCVICYITTRNLSAQRDENDLVSQSSSSEFDDVDTAMHNIFSSDASFDSPSKTLSISHSVTSALQVTPVKLDLKKSKELRLVTIKKTVEKVGKAFVSLHDPLIGEKALENCNGIMDNSTNCTSEDCEQLMIDLKERCANLQLHSDYSGILSLLTLVPHSWTLKKTSHFFKVPISQVRRARILKKEKGILAIPEKSTGRKIGEEEKEIVIDFYLSDKYSRMQPGMKDFVSVKVAPGEKKIKLQKKLLLLNIDEL